MNMKLKGDSLFCPVCRSGKNIKVKLQLKQINFDKATYLCRDPNCTYPLDHGWIIVNRSFSKFAKKKLNPLGKRMIDLQVKDIKVEDVKKKNCDTDENKMEDIKMEDGMGSTSCEFISTDLFNEINEFTNISDDKDDLLAKFVDLDELESLLN